MFCMHWHVTYDCDVISYCFYLVLTLEPFSFCNEMWRPFCVWVHFRELTFRGTTKNRMVIDSINTTRVTKSAKASKEPTIMLANVMSLAPKMDRVSTFIFRHNIYWAFITQTWLKDSLSGGFSQIHGVAVVWKERQEIDPVGVCAYIPEENCKYKQLKDLNCCEDHEFLWPYLRPNCFACKFSCIIAGVIYHPPKANGSLSCPYPLFQSLALTEVRYPNCGLLVTGDCNRLNIHVFLSYFLLKQMVKVPTRKKATLDLILNKMHEYYSPPQACPPFGLSDHTAVVETPKDGRHNINSKKVTMRHDLWTSNKAALGKYLTQINWPLLFTSLVSCEDKWQVFHEVIHSGLKIIMPAKQVKICTANVPWMNESLNKELKVFSA